VSFQVILAGLKKDAKSALAQADSIRGSAIAAIFKRLLFAIREFLHNTNGTVFKHA
jgi:hypothetical protein